MASLKDFLIERKLKLLDWERRAKGSAQTAILAQIQMSDVILHFLSSQQTEEEMEKLRLTLDKQATPVDDIKPRQDTQELTEAIIELAGELEQAWKKDKSGKDLKYPLNNLPEDIKPRSVSSKIYGLRKAGKIPPNILPKTRTIKEVEMVKDPKTGEMKEVKKVREALYIAWVKNYPPVDTEG